MWCYHLKKSRPGLAMHGSRKQERDLPMSSNDIATRVTNPGKGHAICHNPRDRLKQFLIIGVQKAGTTTLFNLLDSIPGFCGSSVKEIGFFTKDVFYQKGESWYLEHFQKCGRGAIKFEASPAYLYYPSAPKRIYSFNRDMKFIVVLREPAARCHSAWNMFRRFNESTADQIFTQFIQHANPPEREAISKLLFAKHYPSFKQAVADDIDRYVSKSSDIEPSFVRRGLYWGQIANYLHYFKLGNFLFLEQGELNHPVTALQKVSDFLNVKIDLNSINSLPPSNIGDYLSCDAQTEGTILMLREFYKPHNEKLFSQIGVHYNWNEAGAER